MISQEFMEASAKGNINAVKELLNSNEINATDHHLYTALHMASFNGHLSVTKELLSKGADPNIVNWGGESALYWASYFNYLEIVKELLMYNADPNLADNQGQTPLHRASTRGHVEVVKELLAKGANPNLKDSQGYTALDYASRDARWAVIKELENYSPTLRMLTLMCIKNHRINIKGVPPMLLEVL